MIGATIKARRKELGITQPELANLADISVNTLYKIERSQGNPTLKVLEKISNILGMELMLRVISPPSYSNTRHPQFAISFAASEGFRFQLTSKNGQVILRSESFSSQVDVNNAISWVQANGHNDAHYAHQSTRNELFYYLLKNHKGELIGTSEMYQTALARENSIESVKAFCSEAIIVEKEKSI